MTRQCLVGAINHEIKQKEQFDHEPLYKLLESKSLARVDNTEELVRIPILSYADRWFRIGKSLSIEDHVEILLTLV